MNSIFILGITGRSGTNYLSSIFKNHPDCTKSKFGAEDYLIYGLDFADNYVKKVSDKWKDKWKKKYKYGLQFKNELKQAIGDGILNYSNTKDQEAKNIFFKTPTTVNISHFFNFFPKSKLIILVRDGRAVIESGVRSNFWNYEKGFLIWNESAKRIFNFAEKNKAYSNQFLIVKYEDLILSFENEVKKIFKFCDLDINKYNFSEVKNIKVFGTSDKKSINDDFKWQKKEKTIDFNPLNRASEWKKIKHIRYNWVCGKNAKKLDYKLKYSNKNLFIYSFNWVYNLIFFFEKIKYKIKPI